MFEIIDDSGGTLLNENTLQYSFLTKHKFQKVEEYYDDIWDREPKVVIVRNVYGGERFPKGEFHEKEIVVFLKKSNHKDLYAIHCSIPGVLINGKNAYESVSFKVLIPKGITDFDFVVKSLTVFQFTLQIVTAENLGIQIFDGSGRIKFCSSTATMRIFDQEMIYNVGVTTPKPREHYQYDKDIAVVCFRGEAEMYQLYIEDYGEPTGFQPFGMLFYINFPAKGRINIRGIGYGDEYMPGSEYVIWYGKMQTSIAYMIVDVTGL